MPDLSCSKSNIFPVPFSFWLPRVLVQKPFCRGKHCLWGGSALLWYHLEMPCTIHNVWCWTSCLPCVVACLTAILSQSLISASAPPPLSLGLFLLYQHLKYCCICPMCFSPTPLASPTLQLKLSCTCPNLRCSCELFGINRAMMTLSHAQSHLLLIW